MNTTPTCPNGHPLPAEAESCELCEVNEPTSRRDRGSLFFGHRIVVIVVSLIVIAAVVHVVNVASGSLAPNGRSSSHSVSGGSSTSPLRSCITTLGNWVIDTDNADANGVSDTQFVFTFGMNSPVTQWIEDELGAFLRNAVQQGQSYADQQLVRDAQEACKSLQSGGMDISNLPQHPKPAS